MAGLLIIFILALTFYILNFSEKTHHISKNQILKEQILKNIKTYNWQQQLGSNEMKSEILLSSEA